MGIPHSVNANLEMGVTASTCMLAATGLFVANTCGKGAKAVKIVIAIRMATLVRLLMEKPLDLSTNIVPHSVGLVRSK